jgi:hypothetical protein
LLRIGLSFCATSYVFLLKAPIFSLEGVIILI